MEIVITNVKEYLLYLCCLASEVEVSEFYQNATYDLRYAQNQISKLIGEKLIRRFSYSTSEKARNAFQSKAQLRLTRAHGDGAAMNFSPVLSMHYDLLCPQQGRTKSGEVAGGRFSGGIAQVERQRRLARLIQHYHYNGIMVDFLKMRKVTPREKEELLLQKPALFAGFQGEKTIFREDGSLLSPEKILMQLEKEEACFLTMKALSRLSSGKNRGKKSNLYRMFGLLIKGETVYAVYMIGGAEEKWSKNSEETCEGQMQRLTSPLRNEPETGRGAAIFYTASEEACRNMLLRKSEKRNQILPEKVYDRAYILPLCRAHPFLEEILLSKDWKKRTTKILLGGDGKLTDGEDYDAMLMGREVFNLIGNDLVKIQRAKVRVKRKPQILLLQDWQEEAVRAYYGNLMSEDVAVWVYSEEEMRDVHRMLVTEERSE